MLAPLASVRRAACRVWRRRIGQIKVIAIWVDQLPLELASPGLSVPREEGQELVGLDGCIKDADQAVHRHLDGSDAFTNRVPPACVARCARGGKTTFLLALACKLVEEQIQAVFISFKRGCRLAQGSGQSKVEYLCRKFAHSITPPDSSLKASLADGSLLCSRDVLQNYFEDKKNYILLIDELNMLLTGGDDNEQQEAEKEVSVFLKDSFVKCPGAYVVFSSHGQFTGNLLTAYMEGDSYRGVEFIRLPKSASIDDFRCMDSRHRTFNGVTHEHAAFFGQIPSLIYSYGKRILDYVRTFDKVTIQNEAPPAEALLIHFLNEVLSLVATIRVIGVNV